jgi:hypothetical protein
MPQLLIHTVKTCRYVWPWAKENSLQHDSYSCHSFSGTRGFPTKRRNETNNFVASVYNENMYIYEECPVKCRREGHIQDWTHC